MQIRADQLEAHLARGLKPLYTVHGDEPLLAQEAGDAIRAAARAAGYSERKVFTASGNHFDWSAVLGAAQAMSLFAERQLIEIRIPSGKPGTEGSKALQQYCERLGEDVLTLVQCPKLDFQQSRSAWFAALDGAGVVLRVEPVERRALPAWIAQRLARQGQQVAAGEVGFELVGADLHGWAPQSRTEASRRITCSTTSDCISRKRSSSSCCLASAKFSL